MANRRRVTEEQERKIEMMSKDGQAASVIARSLTVPYATVLRTMKRMGLPVSRSSRRSGLSSQEVASLVKEYKEGVSTQDLGECYGVNASTVARYVRDAGVEVRPAGFRHGEDHHAWVGGRHLSEDGYVRVWLTSDDTLYEMAQKHSKNGGYVFEHRLVMARSLGRVLEDHETVHHIDGNKQNNALSNLQLRQGKHGKGSAFQCRDCGSHNIQSTSLTESN